MSEMNKFSREFYLRDAVTVARELLGTRLVHIVDGQRLVAEITETEAYCGVSDRACHTYGGRRTERTSAMYLPGGHAYLYLIYGMYDLFNVVVSEENVPCAVLIRGGRVVEGQDVVAQRRAKKLYDALTPKQKAMLLSGPGRFCSGMGLSRALNKADLLGDTLYIEPRPTEAPPFTIASGPRIGVDYAGEDALLPYRFWSEY